MNSPSQPVLFPLILPLNSASATLAAAGGKGMNLSALARAGFDVPPGFILTTAAYHTFVSVNQIQARLLELARSISPDDLSALDAASEAIRALFKNGSVPADLAAALAAAYDTLSAPDGKPPAVAVRSSATAEDLPGLSFAGQQDTYLNILGHEALKEAVKACWGSLWTSRALAYRTRSDIPPDAVALAVVVQALIPSEVSGVLFTANPLTGNRDETAIDATFGLGEAIVSGQVEPDRYVVDTKAQRIVSRKLGAKALAIMPRSEGGTQASTGGHAAEQALPDPQILDLARTGAQVAAHFGSPQDIEWAWAGGRMVLLQSRPITTLYPLPDNLLHSATLRILFSLNSLQGVTDPLTPLGQDLFQQLAGGILRRAGVRRSASDFMLSAGDRLYLDLTDVIASKRGRRLIVDGMLANADPGARQAVQSVLASGRAPVGGVRPASVLRLLRFVSPILIRLPLTWLRPDARRKRAVQKLEQQRAELQQAMQRATTFAQRVAVWDAAVPDMLAKAVYAIMPALIPGIVSMGIVDRLLTRWAGAEPGSVRRLLRGLPYNPTTEMDLQLWAAAQAIRADPASYARFNADSAAAIAAAYAREALPPTAQAAIRSFLDRYGMRAVAEIDLGRPRWREDPQALIQNLSSYLQIDAAAAAPDRVFERAGAEAEQLAAGYVADAKRRKGTARAHLLGALLRRMRLLAGLREMPKFAVIQQLDILRGAMLDSGRELVAQGRLDRADDIFFIPWETLRATAHGSGADLKPIVARRRADYAVEMARQQMPRILLSNGEAFYAGLSEAGSNDLVGDGVSPGTVEGVVHVVTDPRGVRLAHGEILVCPATDPGWTPLFLSAGGLVMELGGMMTHGSVVAREYGIPAVVGVHEATTRLRSGQRVRVDGSAGRVVVMEEKESSGDKGK